MAYVFVLMRDQKPSSEYSQLTQTKAQCEEKLRGLVPVCVRQELEDTISSLKQQISLLQQRLSMLQDDIDQGSVSSEHLVTSTTSLHQLFGDNNCLSGPPPPYDGRRLETNSPSMGPAKEVEMKGQSRD
ncbi:hypothetical protein LSH36_472g02046 [Paralvinella palmiformis]|uniref:Uncharacterized protein n=1 Tax=Paralvinella palmiformis TaxID=53620 RepID=A0AAD9JB20_9ANNE|nr:hypothetical protein LSH36_472g02046 [Paralvinella palmiformis]